MISAYQDADLIKYELREPGVVNPEAGNQNTASTLQTQPNGDVGG
jgi:hypothetical protein